jgi:hypothetical protein
MTKAITIVQWLFLPASALLALKLMEMCVGAIAVLRSPRYARDLMSAAKGWTEVEGSDSELEEIRLEHRFPGRKDWPITRIFLRLPWPLGSFLETSFKYRWLVLIQLIAVIVSINPLLLAIDTILLAVAVWVGILCLLIYRLVFGHADTTFRKTLANSAVGTYENALGRTRQQRVREFFAVFISMVALLITAYAAIYDGLDKLAGKDGGAFEHIPHDWTRSLHLLYFSVVTVATVGYGDIYPKLDSLIARLATASEILAGFVLLILLVTSVSMTFEQR